MSIIEPVSQYGSELTVLFFWHWLVRIFEPVGSELHGFLPTASRDFLNQLQKGQNISSLFCKESRQHLNHFHTGQNFKVFFNNRIVSIIEPVSQLGQHFTHFFERWPLCIKVVKETTTVSSNVNKAMNLKWLVVLALCLSVGGLAAIRTLISTA